MRLSVKHSGSGTNPSQRKPSLYSTRETHGRAAASQLAGSAESPKHLVRSRPDPIAPCSRNRRILTYASRVCVDDEASTTLRDCVSTGPRQSAAYESISRRTSDPTINRHAEHVGVGGLFLTLQTRQHDPELPCTNMLLSRLALATSRPSNLGSALLIGCGASTLLIPLL